MDLEHYTRDLLESGMPDEDVLSKLREVVNSEALAQALVMEIRSTMEISDPLIKEIAEHYNSGVNARDASVGCRGVGDFFIHEAVAKVIGKTGAFIDSTSQDDGGVVRAFGKYIAVAVDGMHSRLSNYPFLGGFHATRAALRDVVVMGAEPIALFSDIHLANDGDVSKIFDYTAGICAVGELLDVPLVSGSTLRVGGDMVLGDRITGCIGAIGMGTQVTSRKGAKAGDVIMLTQGSGGGTITTTAIYNSCHEVVRETLNIDFLSAAIPLVKSANLERIHTLTDVTNGGIRGDAYHISRTAGVKIVLEYDSLRGSVNPVVLDMLDTLEIDFMGVSTDSLMVICEEGQADCITHFLQAHGASCQVVGRIDEGSGVYLRRDNKIKQIRPRFREAAYTPIKKAIGDTTPDDWEEMKGFITQAVKASQLKKERVKEYISSHSTIKKLDNYNE